MRKPRLIPAAKFARMRSGCRERRHHFRPRHPRAAVTPPECRRATAALRRSASRRRRPASLNSGVKALPSPCASVHSRAVPTLS